MEENNLNRESESESIDVKVLVEKFITRWRWFAVSVPKNVLVMREDGDEKVFAQLDLTSENIIHSPFFYLQQNDVVYVEPNKARIVGGNAGAFLPYVLSSISTLVAILAIAIR